MNILNNSPDGSTKHAPSTCLLLEFLVMKWPQVMAF